MKKTRRSAFTIVELVIVIAVIAILSAVLIPTFGLIIQKANIASDQSTAASLTTELHVYLKGETIDSVAELDEALEKSGIGKKLVNKAEDAGYQYWFNMATQSIVSSNNPESDSNGVGYEDNIGGATLVGTDVENNSINSPNSVFRDPYRIGWYMLGVKSSLVEATTNLMNGTADYNDVKKALNYVNSYKDAEDGSIEKKVYEVLSNTIIVTNVGVIIPDNPDLENVEIMFAEGATNPANVHLDQNGGFKDALGNLPISSGSKVDIPSGVVLNEDTFHVEGGADVEFHLGKVSTTDIQNVIAGNVTNATITYVDDNDENVETVIAKNTEEVHQLVTKTENPEDAEVIIEKLVSIAGRHIANTFDIIRDNSNANGNYAWSYDNGNINLYISYNAFVNNKQTLNLLIGDNNADGTFAFYDTYNGADGRDVVEWSSNITVGDDRFATLSITKDSPTEFVVTATVALLNGQSKTVTVNVFVVKPESAKVTVGSKDCEIPFTGLDQSFNWNYDGTDVNTYVSVSSLSNITYKNDHKDARGTSKLELDYDTDVFTYADGKLTLKKDSNGKIVAATKKNADGTTKDRYDITLTVDGCITSTVTAIVRDCTNVPLIANFNQAHTTNYYRNIGNGNIKLSNLMKLKDSTVLPYDSTLVIEALGAGNKWQEITKIEGYSMTCTGSGVTPVTTSNDDIVAWNIKGANWADVTINIEEGDVDIPIRIKITPQTATETTANTITLELNYVEATNVTSLNSIAANGNYVLFGDQNVTDSTKVNLGSGTLYGNGFIINATTYVSTNTSILTDALITVSGGTIDNIYINGPHYPTLDYLTNTGYYVSGIRTTGTSTIQNSYVSGFRQPLMSDGTLLNVVNTTLRGGNYGNLVLKSGNLYLKDVTTVQDQNGIQATVGDKTKKVVGLGIVLEKDTLTSTVTLDGNITHYNWIEKDQSGTLPQITTWNKTLDMGSLFDYIFDGIGTLRIGRFLAYIHQNNSQSIVTSTYKTYSVDEYVNAGIVFIDAQETSSDTVVAESSIKKDIVKFASTYTSTQRKHSLVTMQASDVADMDVTSILGMDVSVGIWSYTDGRSWTKKAFGAYYTATYSTVYRVSTSDLNYSGYYSNYDN